MGEPTGLIDFIHPVLNEEVRTIGGYYLLNREKRLLFGGREVLCYLGCAVVDASCCGPAGCNYALVPGYIKQWKYRRDPDNRWITQVAPLRDKVEQEKLRRLIKENERVQQVNFQR
jgi:hypothetical protein